VCLGSTVDKTRLDSIALGGDLVNIIEVGVDELAHILTESADLHSTLCGTEIKTRSYAWDAKKICVPITTDNKESHSLDPVIANDHTLASGELSEHRNAEKSTYSNTITVPESAERSKRDMDKKNMKRFAWV
jgi:hypothetical protein